MSLFLTRRALSDIAEIERYSVERFGRRTADEYLSDLEAALDRLRQDLTLFETREEYAGRLRFYRVREHVLVGDVIRKFGYVLCVWHGSMDFIDRLPALEPSLVREAELMAMQIEAELPKDA